MGLEQLQAGQDIPNDINVVIEISTKSEPIKYEIDKKSGMIAVDRFISTAMHYPCNYGFIPHTLSEDGDPVDVLVIAPSPLQVNSVIRCRPIGLLRMADESGNDAKILAVPINKLTPLYHHVKKPEDLGKELLAAIQHFFEHYKDLEEGKWVKVDGWQDVSHAHQEITQSITRYQKHT